MFVEWMQMLPEGWVTGIEKNRSKALKMLGNGVVPPQARRAIRHCLVALAAWSPVYQSDDTKGA